MQNITDVASMNRELRQYCHTATLQFDCGCGGSLDSEIAIIAEAPGERECQLKEPLIGGSGKFLWEVLRKDGLTRNRVYMTNVVKRMLLSIGEGKSRKAAIGKQELAMWQNLLREELSYLPNLKYIVVLGSYALSALTRHHAITQLRGSVERVTIGGRDVPILCTYNPAFIMREPRLEIVFRMDLGKLSRLIRGELRPPAIKAYHNLSFEQALGWITYLHDLPDEEMIAYDIECMAGETACVGFAATTTAGVCINFRANGHNLYTLEQERSIRLALANFLADPNKRFVAQNGNFDSYWLWYRDRIRVHRNYFDTMLAHHLLYPSLPHDLGFLTAQYTDHPYYKDEGKEWRQENDIDAFWEYNVKDCCITLACAQRLLVELRAQGLDQFFFNHVMRLQPHLVRMTVGGILCDVGLKATITEQLAGDVEQARRVCQTKAAEALGLSDYEFNPNSTPDVQRLLFDELHLVGRGRSTDKENRKRMRAHPRTSPAAREVIDGIDGYRKDAKFNSTYARSRIDPDNRFRCEYKQTGTARLPGRLSSSQVMWGNGQNLQNIPVRAKPMFIADPGFVFSYYDMAQIEARIVAYLADIPVWKHQFEMARLHPGSYDAHCALASEMFGIPYEQVPREDWTEAGEPTVRYVSKRSRHGLNYRMQADRLGIVTGLPQHQAERAFSLYHRVTPQIAVWWDDVIELVKRDRAITHCLGRRWILLERPDDQAFESIIAFEPQSINGDFTASVIYKCESDPRWPRDARIMMNLHDANIAMHRPADGELVREIMREYAEQPLMVNSVKNRLRGVDQPEPLIVPAEFKMTYPDEHGIHRWSTLDKVKKVYEDAD